MEFHCESYVNTTFLYEAKLALYINSTILRRFNRKKIQVLSHFWIFIELICKREWSRNNIEYIYFRKLEKNFTLSTLNIILSSKPYCQSFSNISIRGLKATNTPLTASSIFCFFLNCDGPVIAGFTLCTFCQRFQIFGTRYIPHDRSRVCFYLVICRDSML